MVDNSSRPGETELSTLDPSTIRHLVERYARDITPSGSPAHLLACRAMWWGHRSFENQLVAALKPFDLSPLALEILLVLRVQVDRISTFPALKTLLGVHPASLTYITDRLERQKRVERLDHPSDRRIIRVRLSDAGEAVIDNALPALNDIGFGFPTLTPEDARRLAEILEGQGDLD